MSPRVPRLAVAVPALSIVAAAMWFAWFGWDDEYYLTKGVEQGPYRAWQVVGCAGCVAMASVLAYVWTRGRAAVFLLAAAAVAGFAVPWTVHAAGNDDSGLFLVGLFLLLVGGGGALVALLALVAWREAAVTRRGVSPHMTNGPTSP